MAHHLLRTFEVSNPRKSYAGPTVYRISCKVTQQGNQPEVVDELIVWRRFSEFKKLHKDLSKFYSKLGHNNLLPSLPRATYFDRFDERVIEERRQNILSFLHFVSEVPQLVEHECLDRFLGGGVYTPTSTSSSRTSSFSGSEGDSSEIHKNIRVSPPESVQESEQGRDSSEDIPHVLPLLALQGPTVG
ncbi:Ribosomal protein S6 kinase delta-1 [Exaiptasia diaphana]|nr:Ribosomal protein S6 kinase delta-1 [Exaiptasia diaphana]